ncbi:MAG: cytochrome b/b6 domain-containing protein [Gemmobacter sp.]|nr:cytochrome b/b6 domain-containing protein [Gemmobacter sp.]
MSTPAYSRLQIRLHWLTAALIVAQFVFHERIATAWDALEDGLAPAFDPLVLAHVLGGGAVLALAVWRLGLRARHGVPPAQGSALAVRAAHWGHLALYGVIIALGLSGAAAWFGGIGAAAELHEALKPVLALLVAGHVAAAVWHHVALKDGTLSRMR